ncbi:MAG: ATP-binding cassette domain-containing protein [marine benthic group bacterium]|jgi:phospholipid/cholesterol/gamma-HCH transport system ATP-binding protein|nr:ATP-binding cassette domain-containing protein [Gemmatimonadota bacterium]
MTQDSLDLWDSQMRKELREEVRKALADLGDESSLPPVAGPVVELEDLCLKFGDHTVLQGVSLDLQRGETLSVLGGSGAGKSTILRLILGLSLPDSGQVRVEGHDIAHAPLTQVLALRRNMGMVFQEAALFDSLSVYDNVGFYLHEHTGLPEEEIRRRVRESLELVDLEPNQVMDLLPAELSGGMKKRVGIARAVVHRPRILLYDEPTSGLDPITTRTINDLISKLQTELDVSSIVVTHDIRSAFRISNRVALLFEGVLVFVGGPEEMVASEDEYVREFLR